MPPGGKDCTYIYLCEFLNALFMKNKKIEKYIEMMSHMYFDSSWKCFWKKCYKYDLIFDIFLLCIKEIILNCIRSMCHRWLNRAITTSMLSAMMYFLRMKVSKENCFYFASSECSGFEITCRFEITSLIIWNHNALKLIFDVIWYTFLHLVHQLNKHENAFRRCNSCIPFLVQYCVSPQNQVGQVSKNYFVYNDWQYL